MRNTNAIDFWRGLALVMIFIDHVPGNAFAYWTLSAFAICDAAELFVFLAGWALSYATGGPRKPEPAGRVMIRLIARAIEVYRAQLVITLMALALLAATALIRQNPIYLEWHNAGPAFYEPVRALIGVVLMSYQLGYFNILPLYVVLLVMGPAIVLIGRADARAALALSVLVWLAALLSRVSMPSWPVEDPWFFNPFSWQLVMTLGFLAGERARQGDELRAVVAPWVPIAALVVGLCALTTQLHIGPDPLLVPEPRLLFVYDKTYVSPIRIINLLALVIAFHAVFGVIDRRVPWLTSWLCSFGRNSLAVFCVGSLYSLVGQIVRFLNQGLFLVDFGIIVSGIGVMGGTAWFVEWRSRAPGASRQRS